MILERERERQRHTYTHTPVLKLRTLTGALVVLTRLKEQ